MIGRGPHQVVVHLPPTDHSGALAVIERMAVNQSEMLAANDFALFCVALYVVCLAFIAAMPRIKTAAPH